MALTKDQILQSDDLKRVEVAVPEWQGSVFVRVLTAGEKDRLEDRLLNAKDRSNFRAFLAAMCVCDENGKPIFTQAEIEKLSAKSSTALDRIFQASQKINAFTSEDVDKLEAKSEATTG